MEFTKKEAEFLYFQMACRRDYFTKEMNDGIKDVTRLKEVSFALDTLQKGIEFFMERL